MSKKVIWVVEWRWRDREGSKWEPILRTVFTTKTAAEYHRDRCPMSSMLEYRVAKYVRGAK